MANMKSTNKKCNYGNDNYYLCEHSKPKTTAWALVAHSCMFAVADMLSEDIYCSYHLNAEKHTKNEFAEVGE
jgi:hypothetical protein